MPKSAASINEPSDRCRDALKFSLPARPFVRNMCGANGAASWPEKLARLSVAAWQESNYRFTASVAILAEDGPAKAALIREASATTVKCEVGWDRAPKPFLEIPAQ